MRLRALLVGLLLASSALPARADEDIRQTFQRGLAEYNLGNYGEAAKLFEDVYRQKPAAALLFNIAQCYRFLGNLQKASTTYRAFLRNAAPGDKNRERGKELLAEVEQALKKQTAVANAAPHGAAAVPDQKEPAAKAEAKKTEPKKAEPQKAEKSEAVAEKAEQKPVPAVDKPAQKSPPTLALATPPRTAPSATAPREATQPAPAPVVEKSHTVAWITAGGAALALAGGGFFGMKSNSTLSSLQSSPHPQAQIDADKAAAKSDAGKANLMFAAGAVLAVASGVCFVVGF